MATQAEVLELIEHGLSEVQLKFLTVEQLEFVFEHFQIEYSPADKHPKENFVKKLFFELHQLGKISPPKPKDPSPDDAEEEKIQIEIEKLRIQADLEKLKIEAQERIELAKIQAPVKPNVPADPEQLVLRNPKLLPNFTEDQPEDFFVQFEKVVTGVWDQRWWAKLVQQSFVGKAREAYAALSPEDSNNYEEIKRSVLEAYELSAEAYRQNFRKGHPGKGTYVEFAASKTRDFKKWVNAANVNGNFNQLAELMVLEEFKNKIPFELRSYLDDKPGGLVELAKLADSHALTKKLGKEGGAKGGKFFKKEGSFSFKKPQNGKRYSPPKEACTKCGLYGKTHEICPPFVKTILCGNCKERGHYRAACPKAKPVNANVKKSKGFQKKDKVDKDTEHSVGFVTSHKLGKIFDEHVFEGVIKSHHSEGKVMLLRDTGAAQSLVLRDVLPKGSWPLTGEVVICKGVKGEHFSVPLAEITLESPVFSGVCQVGIIDELPMKSVHLLLGNDVVNGVASNFPIMHTAVKRGNSSNELICSSPRVGLVCSDSNELICSSPRAGLVYSGSNELICSSPRVGLVCSSSNELICSSSEAELECRQELSGHQDSQLDVGTIGSSVVPRDEDYYPACAVTRSMTRRDELLQEKQEQEDSRRLQTQPGGFPAQINREKLITSQRGDPTLEKCFRVMEGKLKGHRSVEYYLEHGVLCRKWVNPYTERAHVRGEVIRQVVLPLDYRKLILETAHDLPTSGHLGVNATYDRIVRSFFWPGMKRDVQQYCRTCFCCQRAGKPNQPITRAKLYPIPAYGEPFEHILVDCVGPLPRTSSGKEYLLTIMCKGTRYPEAIPLGNIKAKNIVSALTIFFSHVGFPKSIQTDNGSNFTSREFKQFVISFKIEHHLSAPYHPQSQGALERYHQTLKSMLTKCCMNSTKHWDQVVPLLLFCTRDTVQESTGFSPFQLIFGHNVRGPLTILKEGCLQEVEKGSMLEQVEIFREKLRECRELARANLSKSQLKMKERYDQTSEVRTFEKGESCLLFLPITKKALQAKFFGPYKVLEKVSDLNYKVSTPDRGVKERICHINQMKKFHERIEDTNINTVGSLSVQDKGQDEKVEVIPPKLNNSEILNDLDRYLAHVNYQEQQQLKDLLRSYPQVFTDTLGCTNVLTHDLELLDPTPVRQRPYRTSPAKAKIIREEVEYLVNQGLAVPAEGEWASPVLLVPKPDGSSRFCVDYRLANRQIKVDAFPMPRLLDCVDQVGRAKYISKIDLLKGYWQVPLSPRAQQVYSFTTGFGLYSFKVLPFGCKNAPSCFQRLMNKVVSGIPKVSCYLDDIIVYSDTFDEHMDQLNKLLSALRDAKLVVNLAKSEFLQSTVVYLGHIVGHGQVIPKSANVEAILNMPPPTNLRTLRRFLGAAGFYRRFCKNFASITEPLTSLLQKGKKFIWNDTCQESFVNIKAMLSCSPVLQSPDFSKPFIVYTDSSGVGIGGVLMQLDTQGIEKPVAYFSKKLNKHQRQYATVEKECLAIILSLEHFSVYLNNGHTTIVYTDHNPLSFLNKMKEKNQKLLRWSLFLQEYDIEIKHVRGTDNVIADMLSRE